MAELQDSLTLPSPGNQLPPTQKKKRAKSQRRLASSSVHIVSESSDSSDDDKTTIIPDKMLLFRNFLNINDASEYIKSLFEKLNCVWSVVLPKSFRNHLQTVLPPDTVEHSPSIVDLFDKHLLATQGGTIHNIETDLDLIRAGMHKPNILFAQIMRTLLFAPCSEASCERTISQLRFICGRRRLGLSVASLNAALRIATYSNDLVVLTPDELTTQFKG